MKNQSTPIINQYVGLIEVDPFENSLDTIEELTESVISNLDLNVVKKHSHAFFPKGITLVYVLSESHLAIHTWPELGIIHIDLVTCSLRTKEEFEKSLKYALIGYKVRAVRVISVDIDKL